MNFQTANLIILYYPAGAGGKFISNCLSLSKHAVSQNPHSSTVEIENGNGDYYQFIAGRTWPSYAEFLEGATHPEMDSIYQFNDYRKYCKLFNTVPYYDFKLQVVQATLPGKNNMHNWLRHEYGCIQFFGCDISAGRVITPSYVANAISNLDKKFFIVAHTENQLNAILSTFPNATVLKLVNYDTFANLAAQLKSVSKNIPTLPRSFSLEFDIDSAMFNSDKFLYSMEKLYADLGFDDYDRDRVLNFYNAYAQLHFSR